MGATSPTDAAQNLGKYTLIEKLGEGYLGSVYRGFDQDLGGPVVVRILCDGIRWDAKLEDTFERECRAIVDLQHPNIATTFEFGKEGQRRYIAMESLGNGTLENLIAHNSTVPVETKLSIMIQVAEGLGHAHRKGILHRDLGPRKIHLTTDGGVKIRDFSIAGVLMKYLPHPAVRFGAPIYLCPEQIQQKEYDERSDLFSAGTIFYELITHFHPFHDRDSNKALDNILADNPIPTFEKFPDAPPGIWTILKSCLARNPAERYRSTTELADACRDLLKGLAEDTQFMLGELYASLSPLRRAAAQPNASESTVRLLEQIQQLLRGDREPDYAYLDQLMTLLIEQTPAIQAAGSTLPAVGSICPSSGTEESEDTSGMEESFAENPEHDPGGFIDPSAAAPDDYGDLDNKSFQETDLNIEVQAGLEEEFGNIPEQPRESDPVIYPAPGSLVSEQKQDSVAETKQAPDPKPALMTPAPAPEFPAPALTGEIPKTALVSGFTQTLQDQSLKLPSQGSKLPSNPSIPKNWNSAASKPADPVRAENQAILPEQDLTRPAAQTLQQETKRPQMGGQPKSTDTPQADQREQGALSSEPRQAPVVPEYRNTRKRSYRSIAALLSVLVIAAAGYIVFGTDAAPSVRKTWNNYVPSPRKLLNAISPQSRNQQPDSSNLQQQANNANSPLDAMLKEARAAADAGRLEESRTILRRILDKKPTYEPAVTALKEVEASMAPVPAPSQSAEESISRIQGLISAGKLQAAKTEIDRMQVLHPDAPEIPGLRRRLQSALSKQSIEQTRKEEEQQRLLLKQREDDWNRQVGDLIGRGKYNEAAGSIAAWLSESPGNGKAQELNGRVQEIQRHLKTYNTAMAESKYSDALNALGNAERLNPADPGFAELRRQAETRKAMARSILTVHRLGAKGSLLLDGRPMGKDGEVENESIPVGNHTLAIENGGGVIASKAQEYAEGQHVVFVYDLVKQTLRTMTDSDRDLLTQRKAMENPQRFSLQHDHGVFRGNCKGVLTLDSLDVAYSPTSGSHGFRIPFKLLKARMNGKTIGLYYLSDNTHFHTFSFENDRAAEKFKQRWDELKILLR